MSCRKPVIELNEEAKSIWDTVNCPHIEDEIESNRGRVSDLEQRLDKLEADNRVLLMDNNQRRKIMDDTQNMLKIMSYIKFIEEQDDVDNK